MQKKDDIRTKKHSCTTYARVFAKLAKHMALVILTSLVILFCS